MAKKKDMFEDFLEKNFSEESRVKIAKPAPEEKRLSFEERRALEAERQRQESAGAGEGSAEQAASPSGGQVPSPGAAEQEAPAAPRRSGRPKSDRGPVMNMNFLLEIEVKQKLDRLKLDLCRSSVSDLMKEAIHDLFIKYGVK